MNKEQIDDFVEGLRQLANRANAPKASGAPRAALADLRTGLIDAAQGNGKMEKRLYELLPDIFEMRQDEADCFYLTAALFAYHPLQEWNAGSLGKSCRKIKEKSGSIEKRFLALLNSHRDDLPTYLRQIIGLLESNDVGVNYKQLLSDLGFWDKEDRSVQKQWARDFYFNLKTSDKVPEQTAKEGDQE